jgi:hypothetical protein
MTRHRLAVATAIHVMLLLSSPFAVAYEIENHKDMTTAALSASLLMSDPDVLGRLGLTSSTVLPIGVVDPLKDGNYTADCLPSLKKLKVIFLIPCSAEYEDGGSRPLNHFWDPPPRDIPLTVGIQVGQRSPDWALSGQPSDGFSYANARDYMYEALTNTESQAKRKEAWGKVFRSLGQVMHHLEDMAQPQHVRNDQHYNGDIFVLFVTNPSAYEKYVKGTRGVTANPVFVPGQPSPFSKPSKFWVIDCDSGTGIACYTNRNFLSAGTNFRDDPPRADPLHAEPHPGTLPVEDVDVSQDVEFKQSLGPPIIAACQAAGDCHMKFFSSTGPQRVNAERASAESIFDQALQTRTQYSTFDVPKRIFALNRFTFEKVYKDLENTGASYAAGLLNFFFRGALEISLPDEGVYALLDHNDPASNSPQTGGFTKVRLKVRNKTMGAGGGIEPIQGTKRSFVAVARFHKNTCYKADLSGEYGSIDASGNPLVNWSDPNCGRAKEESIVVSQEASVPDGINDDAQLVEFKFLDNKIPISATDLFIQVVYRGQLGAEDDAIAVGMQDVSEPTYLYNYSRWDQYTYCAGWPSLSVQGTVCPHYTYEQWCESGRFPTQEACNKANGLLWKLVYSKDPTPVPGYDPANSTVPADTWTDDLSKEVPFTPAFTMDAPVGKLTRIAAIFDAVPSNAGALIQEAHDPFHGTDGFEWSVLHPRATVNQASPVEIDDPDNPPAQTLTPSVRYQPGRGVYLPELENPLLTGGDAESIPDLILAPSEINPLYK